ncbi:MAG: hypothetical protein O3A51_12590, partial [Verrucomicrobia bacterium]|nr:hypothetical protein [Verrucomicrobiota bacterium]
MHPKTRQLTLGSYGGCIASAFDRPEVLKTLANLSAIVAAPDADVIASGRNRHVRFQVPRDGGVQVLVVKAFGSQSAWKDHRDAVRGSRAHRSWDAAHQLRAAGVGSPAPVAYLERWTGKRLPESYLITSYEGDARSFGDILVGHFRSNPDCSRFMALLQVVADGVRAMHAAGYLHNDLGNQNILLNPDGNGGWRDPMFIDLNRGRCLTSLSEQQRGRDLSRLSLPSDFLRVFIEMYCQAVPPAG